MMSPDIVSARNDLLFGADGAQYIDLAAANGSALLGQTHPDIGAAIKDQIDRLWIIGNIPTSVFADARAAVERRFPANFQLAGFYSTGMEAAEYALRVARVSSGKPGVAGFQNSMHGKSLATATLTWNNNDGVAVSNWHRLAFLPAVSEDQALAELAQALGTGTVGAVLVEPLLGSAGGYHASPAFYARVQALTREHGALLVWDEILTGFHRTGAAFRFLELELNPDVVLIGKGVGNGFPVSGVLVDRAHPLTPQMLPGSTYSNNPLACRAVSATLQAMAHIDMRAGALAVGAAVREHLAWLHDSQASLRGLGALWVVELPAGAAVAPLVRDLLEAGVFVSFAGRQLRIMPALTITPEHLHRACAAIARLVKIHLARSAP